MIYKLCKSIVCVLLFSALLMILAYVRAESCLYDFFLNNKTADLLLLKLEFFFLGFELLGDQALTSF